jgi:hypothetical protein
MSPIGKLLLELAKPKETLILIQSKNKVKRNFKTDYILTITFDDIISIAKKLNSTNYIEEAIKVFYYARKLRIKVIDDSVSSTGHLRAKVAFKNEKQFLEKFLKNNSKIFYEPISESEPSELAKPITRQPSKDTIFMGLNEFIKILSDKIRVPGAKCRS